MTFAEAAKSCDVAELVRLAQAGAIDLENFDGMPPAIFFAWSGAVDGVRAALDVSPGWANQRDAHGNTPLLVAIWRGHADVVDFLLGQPGVDVNAADEKGVTPLLAAVSRVDQGARSLLAGLIGPLIAAGARVEDAIRCAALRGDPAGDNAVGRLLEHACPIDPGKLPWLDQASAVARGMIESQWLGSRLSVMVKESPPSKSRSRAHV